MEREDSLPYSQDPATDRRPDPHESEPHLPILFS
jgi:hypothetical protein